MFSQSQRGPPLALVGALSVIVICSSAINLFPAKIPAAANDQSPVRAQVSGHSPSVSKLFECPHSPQSPDFGLRPIVIFLKITVTRDDTVLLTVYTLIK